MLFAPLQSREAVDAIVFDRARIQQAFDSMGVPERGIVAFVAETDRQDPGAYTRMFAPCLGVLEDPATGGASGPLGSYLFHHNLVTAQQASNLTSLHGFHMGRPSNISISLRTHGTEIEGVRVGGVAVLVSTGQFSSRLLR